MAKQKQVSAFTGAGLLVIKLGSVTAAPSTMEFCEASQVVMWLQLLCRCNTRQLDFILEPVEQQLPFSRVNTLEVRPWMTRPAVSTRPVLLLLSIASVDAIGYTVKPHTSSARRPSRA